MTLSLNRRSLIATAGAAVFTRAQAKSPLAPQLEAAIGQAMLRKLAPGLGVAVYSREGTYARGFGVTDIETGEPVTTATAFYIASSTKALTSLAFAALHGRGELDLDQTLAAFAPDAPFPAEIQPAQVRLRDLLTHTSGIVNNPIAYRVAFTGQHDPQTLWRLLGSSRANIKAPLGRFQYTNVGYNIATILTDRRMGLPWQDLLRREIFEPADMGRASARMSEANARGWSIAKPHLLAPTGRVERVYLEKTDQTMQSAGGVIMSAESALKWLELLVEGGRVGGRQVIPADVMRETFAARTVAMPHRYDADRYGLGWYVGSYFGSRILYGFGGFPGHRSHVSFLPDRGIGVAVVTNDSTLADPLTDVIANYVYDAANGRADAPQRFDAGLDAVAKRREMLAERAKHPRGDWNLSAPREAYVGHYENADWGRIEVQMEGAGIRIRYGVLSAIAEPSIANGLRVELVPGSVQTILFEGSGGPPSALLHQLKRFKKVA